VKVWNVSVEGDQEWLTIPNIAMQFQTRSGNRLVNLNSNPDPNSPPVSGGNYKLQILELSPTGTHEIASIPLLLQPAGQGLYTNDFDVDQALSRLAIYFPGQSSVRLFDLTTGKELSSINNSKDIENVKFSPDGTRLVTGSLDGTLCLWDVQTGRLLQNLTGQTGFSSSWQSLDYTPNGSLIASASVDGSVDIWNANTGGLLHNLPGHSGVNALVVFSRDGKRLLATGEGSTVNLWDVQTGQKLLMLQLPKYPTNLEFSPDGKYLAAGMSDGIMQMWDASTGQELLTLPGYYVKFTEDGKHLLALVNNMGTNVLYGYTLDPNELVAIASTRLTRSWTQEECSKYLHTEVCPSTP
jgi:WD40 repeat protein